MTLVERYKSRNTRTDLKVPTELGWLRATRTQAKGTDNIRETLMVIGAKHRCQRCHTTEHPQQSDWMENRKLELTTQGRCRRICAQHRQSY